MKETLFTRHRNTVEPMMFANNMKATLQALHTDAVNNSIKSHERNVVLDDHPPPINNSYKEGTRKSRPTKIRILWTIGVDAFPPCIMGESPMRSAQLASKDVTSTGSVHKPRGGRVVCMCVTLNRCFVVWVSVLHRGGGAVW